MLCFCLDSGLPAAYRGCLAQSMHGAPIDPFGPPEQQSGTGPSISEQRGDQMPDRRQRDEDPRSYAGRHDTRPGQPGGEERTTMARATAAAVPVMAKNDKGTGPTAKGGS